MIFNKKNLFKSDYEVIISDMLQRIQLLIIGFNLLYFGCNASFRSELAAFGDSVTWGYGDLPGGWVRRIEDQSEQSISNLGIPGERALDAIDRIDFALASAPSAKTWFFLHGGNDMLRIYSQKKCSRTCDPSNVSEDYQEVADALLFLGSHLQQNDKNLIFLTYWPGNSESCPQFEGEKFNVYLKHIDEIYCVHHNAVHLLIMLAVIHSH